jgi:hypothetical protein
MSNQPYTVLDSSYRAYAALDNGPSQEEYLADKEREKAERDVTSNLLLALCLLILVPGALAFVYCVVKLAMH